MKRPVCLIIRDGWGVNPSSDSQAEGDSTRISKTPFMSRILEEYPWSMLKCSGLDVGLKAGFQGNSEVGHINLGSGRVVDEMMVRIDRTIENGSFFENSVLVKAMRHCLNSGGSLHLMGLLQDQGVHAMNTHLYALLKMASQMGLAGEQVKIHIFSDGRDTPPQSAAKYIDELKTRMAEYGMGVIASLHGRYYGMDRDNRWERVAKSYNCLVLADGQRFANVNEALASSYAAGVNDEFVVPCLIGDFDGIHDGDSFIHFNYRLDRARELTHAFTDVDFDGFDRKKVDILYTGFAPYYKDGNFEVVFGEVKQSNILGEVISNAGLKQLRIAETEKYAHVTFFFNAQREQPFPGEDRILIPSPKVATYDLQPEMSAAEVTKRLLEAMGSYDLIVLNFANGDMVGHTGDLDAAIAAVGVVDTCLGIAVQAIRDMGGVALITSDHGNCEKMLDHGRPFTSHTVYDVTCSLVNHPGYKLTDGRLADVAPTILEILGIEQPKEMTGVSLLEKI